MNPVVSKPEMLNTLSLLPKVCDKSLRSELFPTATETSYSPKTDRKFIGCNLFRERVWGKKLITCIGTNKIEYSSSVKAEAMSLTLWQSSTTLTVVFYAKANGVGRHTELERKQTIPLKRQRTNFHSSSLKTFAISSRQTNVAGTQD